jgi:UDP-N-acetylglucosamine 2-epimerase
MQIVTIVGARPQFITAWPMSEALRNAGHEDFLIHTGQHYDYQMSRIFFEELDIPEPNVNLDVGSGSQGQQPHQMLEKIQQALLKVKPN